MRLVEFPSYFPPQAKSQEAYVPVPVALASPPVLTKQPKKPRRKPHPRATVGAKIPRPVKKPASRKSTPRPKLKANKGSDTLLTGQMNHSYSSDNSTDILSTNVAMPLSSDYSHDADPSPLSSDLTDFENFNSALFEHQPQDTLLLSNASDGDSGDNILPEDLPPTTNGASPEQTLFHGMEKGASPIVPMSQWSTASVVGSAASVHGSGTLLNSSHVRIKTEPKEEISSVNRKQPPKPRDTRKSQGKSKKPGNSLGNMLQGSRFINSEMFVKDNNSSLIMDDPMFSPPQGLSGSSDLKPQSNGEHACTPPHVGMDMGAMLSQPQRVWSSVPGGTPPAGFTSPLNSQATISRLTSPPFSPPSISPHISPHPSLGSLFTFDKTQLQQAHLGTPTSPLQFMQPTLKQPFHHRHNDTEQQESDVVDPFLPSVEREQIMFGSHFAPNSDGNLGDLRLRWGRASYSGFKNLSVAHMSTNDFCLVEVGREVMLPWIIFSRNINKMYFTICTMTQILWFIP